MGGLVNSQVTTEIFSIGCVILVNLFVGSFDRDTKRQTINLLTVQA